MAGTLVLLLLLFLLGRGRVGLLLNLSPFFRSLESGLDGGEEFEEGGDDGGFEELRGELGKRLASLFGQSGRWMRRKIEM